MSLDFYLDSVTGQRVTSPSHTYPATDLPSAKLMSTQTVRIQYLYIPGGIGSGAPGTPVAAPSNAIKFGLKAGTVASGQYAATTFDVYTDTFTAPTDPTQATAFYTASLSIDSTALRALFPVDGSGNSNGAADLIGEILSGTLPSETFAFQAKNNLIKGTESPTVSVPGPSGYPTAAQVNTAVTEAAAAEPGLGAPMGTGVIGLLQRTAAGVTSWLAQSTFVQSLLALTNAAGLRTLAGLGTAATANTGTTTGTVPLLGAAGTLADARLSANVPLLDGTGSLSIPTNLEAGNAMIAPEYRINGTDATIGDYGGAAALFYDGTPLLFWDNGGINIQSTLYASFGTASFGDYLSVGNHAEFGTNASFAGGGYFGDSVGFGSNTNFGTSAVFADYGYFGNFGYFGSSVTFADSFGLFGGAAVTVQPDAIADATDLASVIAATNALLANARAFGFIAT